MATAFSVVVLGFLLGMRHAVDPDHVIAVATIVSRRPGARQAAVTGMLWGLGHTLTVALVGAAIVFFNVMIPQSVGLGMELAVGVILIGLGTANIVAYVRMRAASAAGASRPSAVSNEVHVHAHGDYVHTHHHAGDPERHPHHPDQTPLARADRVLGGFTLYGTVRPIVVGIVHGLAGSSAVALLVLAAIQDPRWATAYLLVFNLGTIAGMMLVTVTMASAFGLTEGRSAGMKGRMGLASGVVSVGFGLFIAYQIYLAAVS